MGNLTMTAEITPAENGLFETNASVDASLEASVKASVYAGIKRCRIRQRLPFTEGLRAIFQDLPIKSYLFERKALKIAVFCSFRASQNQAVFRTLKGAGE